LAVFQSLRSIFYYLSVKYKYVQWYRKNKESDQVILDPNCDVRDAVYQSLNAMYGVVSESMASAQ